jgi:hypothetical protein
MSISKATAHPAPTSVEPEVARRILDAIASLDYGAVEVTVHDGRVVQLDKRERTRIGSEKK